MEFIPHDYQKECVEFLEDTKCAGLLLDMGLGKTAIVLKSIHDFMFSHFDTRRTLVIAPKNVARITWPAEIQKWNQFNSITYTVLHGKDKDSNLMLKRDLYIINFDGLKWLFNKYQDKSLRNKLPKFDTVVVDESTSIKNPTSQRSRFVKTLFGDAPRKIILTGTPSPNGYIDLFGQMDWIAPGSLARNITSYRNSYFIAPAPGSPSRKYKLRSGVKDIIHDKLRPYVRVLKEEDVLDREQAQHNIIECQFSKKQEQQYETLEEEFFLELDNGKNFEVFNAASLAMKLRQYVQGFLYDTETGAVETVHSIKANMLKEIVENLNGKPLLCGIQFKHEVDQLRKVFGYKIPALYSKTSEKETDRIIREWNTGEMPLMLAHPASGGVGLNLQDGGSTMLWYAQTWDLLHHQQFIKRIDRQGQKERVMVHHLIMQGTIEQDIVNALSYKDAEQSCLLDALRRRRKERL